jgi:hypothetical protein
MIHYKFKAKYANGGIKCSLDGVCAGKDFDEANTNTKNGVAESMGGDPDNVVVTSMTQYTPRKKKAKVVT